MKYLLCVLIMLPFNAFAVGSSAPSGECPPPHEINKHYVEIARQATTSKDLFLDWKEAYSSALKSINSKEEFHREDITRLNGLISQLLVVNIATSTNTIDALALIMQLTSCSKK